MEQTFIAPIELNFSPEKKNEIFGVPLERAMEMVEEFNTICKDIFNNKEQYIVNGTGEFEGKCRIDEGAVLKRIITVAKNINEWAFTIYSAASIYENLELNWKHRKRLVNSFLDIIAELIQENQK